MHARCRRAKSLTAATYEPHSALIKLLLPTPVRPIRKILGGLRESIPSIKFLSSLSPRIVSFSMVFVFSGIASGNLSIKLLVASEKAMDLYNADIGICFFDDELEAEVIREGEIKAELARIETDEGYDGLHLKFQPILDPTWKVIFSDGTQVHLPGID
jgi:hypothetical protein